MILARQLCCQAFQHDFQPRHAAVEAVAVENEDGSLSIDLDELREAIYATTDYEGVTGSGTYTEGGVNDVARAYTPFNDDGSVGEPIPLDGDRALEIIEQIAVQAECDENNVCTW